MPPESALLTEVATLSLLPAMSANPSPNTGVGTCAHPIKLYRTSTDTSTGEVRFSEHDKRCGSRINDRCPSCSALYRGDAFQVIRSGIIDSSTKLPKLLTMITLTAPGAERFGNIHSRNSTKAGKLMRCKCRKYHAENDPVIGTPIDPDTYDYAAAADFNANATRLFAVSMQKLNRVLNQKLKVVRVVEFQKRGLVHIHAIVLGPITQRSLELIVSGGTNLRTGRKIAPATSGGWTWGKECKAVATSSESSGKAIAYMVKVINYALKDTGHGECKNGKHRGQMSKAAGKTVRCDNQISDCHHGNRYFTITLKSEKDDEVSQKRVQVLDQGERSHRLCRRHRRAENGWGFRGHVLSKSGNWGCTFQEVRARRLTWNQKPKSGMREHIIVEWSRSKPHEILAIAPGNSPP
ncbi:MAG: hypothetical protein EBU84_06180 [Actinobacteria bacterium]|nr:hypothetical protein [Actinomycetota bacterium]